MKTVKRKIDLKVTLKALERSLVEWDNIRADKTKTDKTKTDKPKTDKPKNGKIEGTQKDRAPSDRVSKRESEVALKTHLLFQALKDQIDELS